MVTDPPSSVDMTMRGAVKRRRELLRVDARAFAWDSFAVATMRHSTLPWGDAFAIVHEIAATPLANLAPLGSRDRLSLLCQFAAHEAFLQFSGIADGVFDPCEWAVILRRGEDCRLVRTAAAGCEPTEAPSTFANLQRFADKVGAPALDGLRQPWARVETVFIEAASRLAADAAADLRWVRDAARGEVLAPGPDSLRLLWKSGHSRSSSADRAVLDAFRAAEVLDPGARVVALESSFPLRRYSALEPLASLEPEMTLAAAVERLQSRLRAQHHVVIVAEWRALDEASREALEAVSAMTPATWVFPDGAPALPDSRMFVVTPSTSARALVDERLQLARDRREAVRQIVAAPGLFTALASGEFPLEEFVPTLAEPNRSLLGALALLGCRVTREKAERYLAEFLFRQRLEDLQLASVAEIEGSEFVFRSEGVRRRCAALIPPASRPALCKLAAPFTEGVARALLLIESGDSGEAVALLERSSWSSDDEAIAILRAVPRSLLSQPLATRLAGSLIARGRYRDAKELLASLTGNGAFELLLAQCERRTGDYGAALARVERSGLRTFEAQVLRAEVLRLQGDLDAARAEIAAAPASDAAEFRRAAYELALLDLESGRVADTAWMDGGDYYSIRFETYCALSDRAYELAAGLASRAIALAPDVPSRIDALLDRVYASFSAGRWDETRNLALEALGPIEETQGDRAAGGIIYTLAFLAADNGLFQEAAHHIDQLRRYYLGTSDALRMLDVDLLAAHLDFCAGRFAAARRSAAGVWQREVVQSQIREAAALILDEIDWVENRDTPLRSTGGAGNAGLAQRHASLVARRCGSDDEVPDACTAAGRLALFRRAIRNGDKARAQELAASLGLSYEPSPAPAASDVTILQTALIAPYPYADDAFGAVQWSYASRNRLGHWSRIGPASLEADDSDRIRDAANDWLACGDRERLYVEGSGSWSSASREAVAAAFRTRAEIERLQRASRQQEEERTWRHSEPISGLIGESAAMREIASVVGRVAARDVPVLVVGESGTGKEVVARAIHARSPRKHRPFVAVNCAALPENLIESELFGHVRGAFTGADRDRVGIIEAADEGTLFLDEIGDLPAGAQAKMLRFLQDGEFRRVGDSANKTADVRVVSATNRKLEAAVDEGRFREDLFYRIRVIEIAMPPLRERGGDVGLLASAFLSRERAHTRSGAIRFSNEAEMAIRSYRWPGNVRELQNAIRAAHAMAGESDEIDLEHLPERVRQVGGSALVAGSYQDAVTRFRRDLIEKSLTAASGNQNRAAALLNMSRQALAYQIRELGILVQKQTAPGHRRM